MRMAKYDPFSIITGRKKKKAVSAPVISLDKCHPVSVGYFYQLHVSFTLQPRVSESVKTKTSALGSRAACSRSDRQLQFQTLFFFLLGCVLFQECIYLLNHYIHTTKQYGRFSIAGKHWWSELCITELFKSAILKPAANIIDAAILNGGPQSENSRQSDSAGCVVASFYFHILRI